MKRFLVFPLFMNVAGAISVSLTLFEKLLPSILYIIFQKLNLPLNFMMFFQFIISEYGHYVFKGALVGIFMGILLAFWDIFRNRRREVPLTRLSGNFFWCILMGFTLGLVNSSLFFAFSSLWPRFAPNWFSGLYNFAVALPNFTAIFWAAIRSITTDDVLTPRVLLNKLRERPRLN